MPRAVFISRTAANLAIIKAGKAANVSEELIMSRGRVYPVYKRGEMKGYEAWYPVDEKNNLVVME